MATQSPEKPKRHLPSVSLAESYRICDRLVSDGLSRFLWMGGNLPRGLKPHVNSILALTVRVEKLCDIHVGQIARADLLEDLREDFRNNFMQEETTDQFPALLDTVNRFSIPQQFLHDIVAASDMCTRIERFDSFDQWLQLGCRLGGGTMLSVIPVLGSKKSVDDQTAIACGQAIFLTRLLADIADEIQKLEYFLPAEDLQHFNLQLAQHNPAKPSREMLQVLRKQVSRIERLFQQGGKLVHSLDLDGRRVLSSVIEYSWNLLMRIKVSPESFLQGTGGFSRKQMLAFRIKHLMGLEGGVPVIPESSDGAH